MQVRLTQALSSPTAYWGPGELFTCASPEAAADLIAAGIAEPVVAQQTTTVDTEEKPKKRKG